MPCLTLKHRTTNLVPLAIYFLSVSPSDCDLCCNYQWKQTSYWSFASKNLSVFLSLCLYSVQSANRRISGWEFWLEQLLVCPWHWLCPTAAKALCTSMCADVLQGLLVDTVRVKINHKNTLTHSLSHRQYSHHFHQISNNLQSCAWWKFRGLSSICRGCGLGSLLCMQ